ncbi:ATP-binding cassette sub-family A member 5, partial [Caerostris extrusa]
MFNEIATVAKRSMMKFRGESLSSSDIQTAVKAVLKNGVSKHAEIGGIAATKNFEIVTDGQEKDTLRRELQYVNNSNFHYFIRKTLRDVDKKGDASISIDALEIMDRMLFTIFGDLAMVAKRIRIRAGYKTFTSLDIQTAASAVLKNGVSKHAEVHNWMEELDLTSCSSTLSIKLNTDQKRKLCVAIAAIGEPDVLLLDEPSSGMSPKARKLLWNVLQDYAKAGRAVVFITHHMDEAELLSGCLSNRSLFLRAKQCLPSLLKDLPSNPKIVLTTDTEIYVKLRSFIGTHCAEFFRKIEEHFKDITCNCFTISLFSLEDILYFASGKTKEDEAKCVRIPRKEEETGQNKSSIFHRKFTTLILYRKRLLLRNINAAFILVIPILLILVVKGKFYPKTPEPSLATIGPHLYRNETIHVVNETGKKSLAFLETSMSKLDVTFVIKNPTEKFQSKSFYYHEYSKNSKFLLAEYRSNRGEKVKSNPNSVFATEDPYVGNPLLDFEKKTMNPLNPHIW